MGVGKKGRQWLRNHPKVNMPRYCMPFLRWNYPGIHLIKLDLRTEDGLCNGQHRLETKEFEKDRILVHQEAKILPTEATPVSVISLCFGDSIESHTHFLKLLRCEEPLANEEALLH